MVKMRINDAPVVALAASLCTYIKISFTESNTGKDNTSSVCRGSFPTNKVSQNESGTMDIMRKKTNVPAIVVYFLRDNKSYFFRKYIYSARNFSIVLVCRFFPLFKPKATDRSVAFFLFLFYVNRSHSNRRKNDRFFRLNRIDVRNTHRRYRSCLQTFAHCCWYFYRTLRNGSYRHYYRCRCNYRNCRNCRTNNRYFLKDSKECCCYYCNYCSYCSHSRCWRTSSISCYRTYRNYNRNHWSFSPEYFRNNPDKCFDNQTNSISYRYNRSCSRNRYG